MTDEELDEEAQAAYDAAPSVPLSEQRIKEMVDYAVGRRTEMPSHSVAIRPRNVRGDEIEMGPWYWIKSRTGKIVGAGRFASPIGSTEILWYINETGYSPEGFKFLPIGQDPVHMFDAAIANNRTEAGPDSLILTNGEVFAVRTQ